MRNLIRRIRPEKTGVRAPLGELEQAVMRCIWQSGEQGSLAAEVQRALEQERPVALTTVLTTLERLREKAILEREREGKAYRYRAALSEEQLQQRIVEGVLDNLIAQFPKAVATYFAQQGLEGSVTEETETEALESLAVRLDVLRAAQQEPTSEDGDV